MHRKGIFFTVLSAILFGITPILASFAYANGANAMTVVFFRSLFVLPILYLLMKVRKIPLTIHREDLKHTAIIAFLGSGLTTILLFSSYQYIDVGTATTLHFLYPLCVSLLCFIVYREKLGRIKLFALFLAALGTFCFIDFEETKNMVGFLLAIASAIAYAFYMVQLAKKHLTKRNPFLISFYMAFFTMIETILYHLFIPSIHIVLPFNTYLILIILSIVSSFLAVVLLQMGIRDLGPSTASIFCLFEPITSIIAGYYILHDELTLIKIIGCLIILSSLVFVTFAKREHR